MAGMKTVNNKKNRFDKLTLLQVTVEKNKKCHLTHTVLKEVTCGWLAEKP